MFWIHFDASIDWGIGLPFLFFLFLVEIIETNISANKTIIYKFHFGLR